jgi:hypothetical protein
MSQHVFRFPDYAYTHTHTHTHTGTCFTAADIDQKHREMIWGFMPPEASLMVALARQQLLTADKSVLKEQQGQGAFIHQALLKVLNLQP